MTSFQEPEVLPSDSMRERAEAAAAMYGEVMEKIKVVANRIAAMFGRVQPGEAWWFWFERKDGTRFVSQVCRDGSNNLWVEDHGEGKELLKYMLAERIRVLCPVEAPK